MWKLIPKFEKYEISNSGVIRSVKNKRVKSYSIANGKEVVYLYHNNKRRTFYVKDLMNELFPSYILPDKVQSLVDEAIRLNLLSQEDVNQLFGLE